MADYWTGSEWKEGENQRGTSDLAKRKNENMDRFKQCPTLVGHCLKRVDCRKIHSAASFHVALTCTCTHIHKNTQFHPPPPSSCICDRKVMPLFSFHTSSAIFASGTFTVVTNIAQKCTWSLTSIIQSDTHRDKFRKSPGKNKKSWLRLKKGSWNVKIKTLWLMSVKFSVLSKCTSVVLWKKWLYFV